MNKWASHLSFFGLGLFLYYASIPFAAVEGLGTRWPGWDPAGHGFDGALLYHWLTELRIDLFLYELWNMSYWPGFFPLVEVPTFAVFGTGFLGPRLLVIGSYLGFLAASFLVVRQIKPQSPWAWLAVAFLGSSQFLYELSLSIMVEIPGLCLWMMATVMYLRYIDTQNLKYLKWAAAIAAALFLTKYNYGIMFYLGVLAFEWRSWWSVFSTVKRGPFLWFSLIYLLILAWIYGSGGGSFQVAGQTIHLKTVGNPLYVYFVAALIRIGLLSSARNGIKHWWRRLSPAHQVWFKFSGIPIGLWFANPANLRTFFYVVKNQQDTGYPLWSGETFSVYWNAFIHSYAPHDVVGIAVYLGGLAFALRFALSSNRKNRFLALSLLVSWILVTLHPHKLPRYFVTVVPLLAIAGTYWLGQFRWRSLATGLAIPAIVFMLIQRPQGEELDEFFKGGTGDPSMASTVGFVCDGLREDPNTLILGHWEGLSDSMIRWGCLQLRDFLPKRTSPSAFGIYQSRLEPRKVLEQKGPSSVMFIHYESDDSRKRWQYQFDNRWLGPVHAIVKDQTYFQPIGATHAAGHGYEIQLYRRL